MTESEFPPNDETFLPSPNVESAAASSEGEPTNVCRVAALAALFDQTGRAPDMLSSELQELGFSQSASRPLALFGSRRFSPYDWLIDLGLPSSSSESRMTWWAALNETSDTTNAGRFLVAVLGSSLERESAAAAATLINLLPNPGPGLPGRRRLYEPYGYDLLEMLDGLSRALPRSWTAELSDADDEDAEQVIVDWDGDTWADVLDASSRPFRDRETQVYLLSALVVARLRIASRSPDPITRSFAFARQGLGRLSADAPGSRSGNATRSARNFNHDPRNVRMERRLVASNWWLSPAHSSEPPLQPLQPRCPLQLERRLLRQATPHRGH
jgi:hypothetical protein